MGGCIHFAHAKHAQVTCVKQHCYNFELNYKKQSSPTQHVADLFYIAHGGSHSLGLLRQCDCHLHLFLIQLSLALRVLLPAKYTTLHCCATTAEEDESKQDHTLGGCPGDGCRG